MADEPFVCHLSPMLLFEIASHIPFMTNTQNILLSNSTLSSLFLEAHPPSPHIAVGQSFKNTNNLFVTSVFLDGRVLEVRSNDELTNARPAYVLGETANLDQESCCMRCKDKFVIKVEDDNLVIKQVEYQIPTFGPIGYYLKGDDQFYHKDDMPTIHTSLREAQSWMKKIESIKPGDCIQLRGKKVNDAKRKSKKQKKDEDDDDITDVTDVIVDTVFFNQEHCDSIPDWLIPLEHRNPYTYKRKGGKMFLSLKGIVKIQSCSKTPCYVEKGNVKYSPDQYVVVSTPGFPMCKIVETYECSYEVEEEETKNRWFFKHNRPIVTVFDTRKAAVMFKTKKTVDFIKHHKDLKAGDMVLRKSVYSLEKDHIIPKFQVIKRTAKVRSKGPHDLFVSDILYYFNEKDAIMPTQVADFEIAKELEEIKTLSFDKYRKIEGPVTVCVGDTLDGFINYKNFKQYSVDRIIRNGIVLRGTFYQSDKVEATYVEKKTQLKVDQMLQNKRNWDDLLTELEDDEDSSTDDDKKDSDDEPQIPKLAVKFVAKPKIVYKRPKVPPTKKPKTTQTFTVKVVKTSKK